MPDGNGSNEASRRFARIATASVLGALALAAVPATAMGASATVTQSCTPDGNCVSSALFTAASGEVNDVRVRESASGKVFSFFDANNTISAGTHCRRTGRTVRCTPGDRTNTDTVGPARVRANNLDDQVEITGGRASINGGSGNDTLTTEAVNSNTTVAGSTGNDVLVVSPTSAVGHSLNGNSGNDTITGGPFGDGIGGGSGNDSINARGGDDTVDGDTGDDTVTGGTGPDRLLGDDGDDRLFGNSGRDRIRGQNGNDGIAGGNNNDRLGGGPGRDRLFGNNSNDLLVGNGGRDRFRAGPGNDRVNSVDGIQERVNCGSGFDRATIDRTPMDITAFCNRIRRVTFRR